MERPDAIMVFGGRLSTTDFATTLLFNLSYHRETVPLPGPPSYDNDIAGVEYEHDLFDFKHDLHFLAEVGLADRFGHYLVCCQVPGYPDSTVLTNNRIHTFELWTGGKFRWDNFHLGDFGLLEVAVTGGFSAVSRPLGRERQRQIDDGGNAHFLYYFAPEIGFSLRAHPNLELVMRVPHRSGGGGTLGDMEEAYNANVLGLRYSF